MDTTLAQILQGLVAATERVTVLSKENASLKTEIVSLHKKASKKRPGRKKK